MDIASFPGHSPPGNEAMVAMFGKYFWEGRVGGWQLEANASLLASLNDIVLSSLPGFTVGMRLYMLLTGYR